MEIDIRWGDQVFEDFGLSSEPCARTHDFLLENVEIEVTQFQCIEFTWAIASRYQVHPIN